jgi:signal transduction histidine kinase
VVLGEMAQETASTRTSSRNWALTLFELAIVAPTVTLLALGLTRNDAAALGSALTLTEIPGFDPSVWGLLIWVVIVALVELVPVPTWRDTAIGMGFPLLMVVAFIYNPVAAAAAAFLAASDPRELRGEVGLLRALFNRSQVALAVWAASAIFQSITSIDSTSPLELVTGASLAAVADYLVNFTLVALAAGIAYRMHPVRVIRELRLGRLSEFVISYLGLAMFGLILAKVFLASTWYAVPALVIPLLLARQMFFRTKALEKASKELQDREHLLRALSNRMAEERQDERQQIAAFLHDDLAQLLFRLSIQVDVARRHLEADRLDDAERLLGEIKETKNRTSDRIRALIRDLHRSPLGRKGLGEALQSFIAETGRDSDVRYHTDVQEVDLPAPIALLMYHIAREGVMNSLKHAQASNMWISVRQDGDEVEMVLRDDGVGFDVDAPEPEGHFGLTMMRERALVGGGTYEVASKPGEGATTTVRFPTSWLQEEGQPAGAGPESPAPQPPHPGGASREPSSRPSGAPSEPVRA